MFVHKHVFDLDVCLTLVHELIPQVKFYFFIQRNKDTDPY